MIPPEDDRYILFVIIPLKLIIKIFRLYGRQFVVFNKIFFTTLTISVDE